MEAAYLFGGGVALLACFQPFQDFREKNIRLAISSAIQRLE
jgi:hypothetical protein